MSSDQKKSEERQAAINAIAAINAVEGFDPAPLAVEYTDLNTKESRSRLPVMAQLAWFRLKYPEGRIAISVTSAKDCFVATAMSMWMGSICAATGVESLKMWPSWWQSRSMRTDIVRF